MIWPNVYRHSTADSLAALSLCEAKVLEPVQSDRAFYKFGRLLLRHDFLSSTLESSLYERSAAVVRLMTGRSPLYWQATSMLAKRIPVRSAAIAIMLKNNIRAVYPQLGLTLKVSNPNDAASSGRIVNEATNRKMIKDAGGITVPQITQSSTVQKEAYILETLLGDYRPVAASDMNPGFISGFVAFQIANRTEAFSVQNDFEPVAEIAKFENYANANQLNIPARLHSFLKTAGEQKAATAPCSLCHGDLSRSNILVSNKQFAVIDWEFSLAAPAATDAVRLATQFPGFADAYIKELRNPDARVWFVLGCIHAANAHQQRLDGLTDNRHRQKAGRKTARKIARIIALADSHAMQRP